MAIIGGILLLVGIVIVAEHTQSYLATLSFTLAEIVLLFLLIKYLVKYIPMAKQPFSIYLHKDQEGYQASSFDKNAIGKKGTVISDLKPGGYILVDGKKQQAISQSGYLVEGSQVIVIEGDGDSLIVKEFKKSNEEK